RLAEPAGDGTFAFVHHEIGAAILAATARPERRRLHQRAARTLASGLDLTGCYEAAAAHVLARTGPTAVLLQGRPVPSRRVYAVARHTLQGEPALDPHEAFLATRAAGVLALAEHAPYESVAHLEA